MLEIVEPKVRKTGPLPCSLKCEAKCVRRERNNAVTLLGQGMQDSNDRIRGRNAAVVTSLGFGDEPVPSYRNRC